MKQDLFNSIRGQYGKYASWAVWNDSDRLDTQIIEDNTEILHSRVIVLALNISKLLTTEWSNFRSGKHDRKLINALNQSSYRGAYLTDYFKDTAEPDSKKLINAMRKNDPEVLRHTQNLLNELRAIGATPDSLIVIMGGKSTYLYSLYLKHIQPSFPKHICHYHYSYRGLKDEVWVEQLWSKIEVKDPTFIRPK